MTNLDPLFVDPLDRRAVEVSAKLGRWVKNTKIPMDLPVETLDAFQDLRNASSQIVPNIHHALTVSPGDATLLALAALDSCVDALHTLLGALPTDPKAFSVVDDLMSLRDEAEAAFPDARRRLTAVSEEHPNDLAGTGAHRFHH